MSKDLISIQEAADLSNKSIQTIRRAIKAKKFKFRRDKTPQGFNYLVEKDSLFEFYGVKEIASETPLQTPTSAQQEAPVQQQMPVQENVSLKTESDTMTIDMADFRSFAQTLNSMLSQHSEERQNFLRLVNTMQEKIFVLENQINLLRAPQKKWFSFWK